VAPRTIAAFLAVLVLGCAAEPVPQDRYYRLASRPDVASGPDSPALDATVVVERFAADGLTRDRAIVYSEDGSDVEVQRHLYHHWTEPPAELLRDDLVRYLRSSGVARRIVTPELRVPADYEITGHLQRFERVLEAARVRVRLALTLRDRHTDGLVWSGIYEDEARADGDSVSAAVRAFNRALESVFARFVRDIVEHRVETE
jgi:ABC-type uncharacterized transport system auxiliary subunit